MTRDISLLACVWVAVAGCGGAGAGHESTSSRAPTPGGTSATAQDDPRPDSDRGLATWPRPDAPPFPVDEFVVVASPLGERLPPERLARIAAFIRWYEQDPYDPGINRWGEASMSTRAAVLAWVTESPDVQVSVAMVLPQLAAQRGEDPERIGQYTTVGSVLGMAAHAIENPGLDPRDPRRQAEGIASGLRWYEAAVRRGAPRSAFLDELITIRDRGELPTWFSERVTFND